MLYLALHVSEQALRGFENFRRSSTVGQGVPSQQSFLPQGDIPAFMTNY